MVAPTTLRAALPRCLDHTDFPGLGEKYEGKVRDNYSTRDGRRYIAAGEEAVEAALPRLSSALPWLRPIVVDPAGRPVPPGVVGAIRHIDCANRSSVVAIDTEDLGALTPAGLLLLGREEGAALRGCSLDAEALFSR